MVRASRRGDNATMTIHDTFSETRDVVRAHGATAPHHGRSWGWRSWPEWSSIAAAIWSLGYACLGVWWMTGHAGFPFGGGPPPGQAASSLLYGVRVDAGAPTIAILGFVATGVAVAMRRVRGRGGRRSALLSFAWVVSVTLLIVIPDARALAAAAYAPVFLIGAPFGWPPVDFSTAIPWPILNQHLCMVGGLLWGASALAFSRQARGACPACGRRDERVRWTDAAVAAQWGRWTMVVAVIIPLIYATTRYAWMFGFPLGISEEFLREGQRTGMWYAGGALATVATCGAILTTGLVARWGEVFPSWIPGLRGRRVPIPLAVVPAALVSALVTAGGLGVYRAAIVSGNTRDGFGAFGPALIWPVWGLALGATALAYYYRRRGVCARCGRGRWGSHLTGA